MSENKKKQYDKKVLEEAVRAVKQLMPCNKVSETYRVPRSTIQDKIKGRYMEGKTSGPGTIGTEEEETLVNWLFHITACGFPGIKDQPLDSTSFFFLCKNFGLKGSGKGIQNFLKEVLKISHSLEQDYYKSLSEIGSSK